MRLFGTFDGNDPKFIDYLNERADFIASLWNNRPRSMKVRLESGLTAEVKKMSIIPIALKITTTEGRERWEMGDVRLSAPSMLNPVGEGEYITNTLGEKIRKMIYSWDLSASTCWMHWIDTPKNDGKIDWKQVTGCKDLMSVEIGILG